MIYLTAWLWAHLSSAYILKMNKLDDLPPAYLPEPVNGPRPELRIHDSYFRSYSTRRVLDSGPYGTFIKWIEEPALYSRSRPISDHRPHWNDASPLMAQILWGSSDERQNAREQLREMNEYINTRINSVNGDFEGSGNIPVENWFQAGEQLDLAIKDAVNFRSTARFEDIRDFICELIKNFSYPQDWRVQRFIFEQKVIDRLPSSHSNYGEWWDSHAAPSEPDDLVHAPTARRRLRLISRSSHRGQSVRRNPGRHAARSPVARGRGGFHSSQRRPVPHLSNRRRIPTRESQEAPDSDRIRRRRMRNTLHREMMNEESSAMSRLAIIR